MAAIRTRLVRIGNSRGIRIPKPLGDHLGLHGEVEIEAKDGQLLIRPAHEPRSGWDAHFQAMEADGEDRLLDGLVPTAWENSEWQWMERDW